MDRARFERQLTNCLDGTRDSILLFTDIALEQVANKDVVVSSILSHINSLPPDGRSVPPFFLIDSILKLQIRPDALEAGKAYAQVFSEQLLAVLPNLLAKASPELLGQLFKLLGVWKSQQLLPANVLTELDDMLAEMGRLMMFWRGLFFFC